MKLLRRRERVHELTGVMGMHQPTFHDVLLYPDTQLTGVNLGYGTSASILICIKADRCCTLLPNGNWAKDSREYAIADTWLPKNTPVDVLPVAYAILINAIYESLEDYVAPAVSGVISKGE